MKVEKARFMAALATLAVVAFITVATLVAWHLGRHTTKPRSSVSAASIQDHAGTQSRVAAQQLAVQRHNTPYEAVGACDIFPLPVAQQLLGATAKLNRRMTWGNTPASYQITECGYSSANGREVDVKLRSVLTVKELASTRATFTAFSAHGGAGTQRVEGFGDAAYFETRGNMLNILTGTQWVSMWMKDANGTTSLESAKQVAKAVLPWL